MSDTNLDALWGVGGSALDLSLEEIDGVDEEVEALEGEEHGEQSGVRGYLDLLGELKQ